MFATNEFNSLLTSTPPALPRTLNCLTDSCLFQVSAVNPGRTRCALIAFYPLNSITLWCLPLCLRWPSSTNCIFQVSLPSHFGWFWIMGSKQQEIRKQEMKEVRIFNPLFSTPYQSVVSLLCSSVKNPFIKISSFKHFKYDVCFLSGP